MPLRLSAIPITIPQLRRSEVPPSAADVRVNCVLHDSASQEIEVCVNERRLTGIQEGEQTVFSWQLCKPTDLVHITLLKGGRRLKEWQGCWNGQDAILHYGSLPIQVVFDGTLQPIVDASMMASLLLTGGTENGSHQADEPDTQHPDPSHGPPTRKHSPRLLLVQDLLVLAENPSSSSLHEEREVSAQAVSQQEEANSSAAEIGPPEEEEDRLEEVEASEGVLEEATDLPPEGKMRVAAFHAGPLQTLQALQTLVATMPQPTLIVDLRPSVPKRRRAQDHSELSMHHLQERFGGTYWNRGWAIQTNLQRSQEEGWRSIMTQSHAQGLPALEERLREGWSLILMDATANYRESRRQAVIEALRQALPDLDVSPFA